MIKNAFIGFIVSLLCIAPPVIHFVTGPLGPFIGGWIAGSRTKSSLEQSMVIGFIMGFFMTFPVLIVMVVSRLNVNDEATIDGILLILIGLGVLWYTTVLGAIGAALGGRMTSKT